MLLFAFVLSWAIVRAFEQTGRGVWAAGRSRTGVARTRIQRRIVAARSRDLRHPSRWLVTGATIAARTSRGLWRAGRYLGRDFRDGWRRGVTEGRDRHTAFQNRRDSRGTPASASGESPPTAPVMALACPECGEPAVARPPKAWTEAWGPRPAHSHLDGEPLCPVVGPDGYRPAEPGPATPGTESEQDTPDQTSGRPAGEPPSTEGEPMSSSGEVLNIETARAALQAMADESRDFTGRVDTLSASLAGYELDAKTLGEVSNLMEAAETAAKAADAALRELNTQHGAVEEAINATQAANDINFYKH